MNKTTGIRLSDKEHEELLVLKKAYNISNTSELLRMLIRKDYTTLTSYKGIDNLSDKQIIQVGLNKKCKTIYRKEI